MHSHKLKSIFMYVCLALGY